MAEEDPVLAALNEADDPVLAALSEPPRNVRFAGDPNAYTEPEAKVQAKARSSNVQRQRDVGDRAALVKRGKRLMLWERAAALKSLGPDYKPQSDEDRDIGVALEHERLRGVPAHPLAKEAVATAGDVLQSPQRLLGAGLKAASGDTKEANRLLTPRTPIYPNISRASPEAGMAAEVVSDPMMGIGAFAKPATTISVAERASLGRGFDVARRGAAREIRAERGISAMERLKGMETPRPTMGEIGAAARSDEAMESIRRLAASDQPGAIQAMEDARLREKFVGTPRPSPAPEIIDPTGPVPHGQMRPEVPATLEKGLPVGAYDKIDDLAKTTGAEVVFKYGPEKGKVGRVTGVQPNGTLLVSVGGRRPGLVNRGDVDLWKQTKGTLVPDAPPQSTALIKGPSTALQTPQKGPMTVATPMPPVAEIAAQEAPGTVAAMAGGSKWTEGADKATRGMWKWAAALGADKALRGLVSRSKFHEFSETAGDLWEGFIASKAAKEGDVGDLLIPAERQLRAAKPTVEATEGMFKYASGRQAELPPLVRDNPAVAEAIDYYNGVLRPARVKAGLSSVEAFEEFPRYLPNIVTAEMETGGLFRGAVTKLRQQKLRHNHPGAILENVTKEEAKALAEALPGKPVVVGPYGKNSYIKYANPADRDAFLALLDAERRGAGLKSGKIRYESFEKIPDEWLEKAVAEGGGGLVKDPTALLAHGMKQAANELAAAEFFQKIRNSPGMATELVPGQAPMAGWAAIPNTPRWGALRGMQVPEKLREALTAFEPTKQTFLGEAWTGAMRAFKQNAVVKIATGARNIYDSATTLSIGNRLMPGTPAWFKQVQGGIEAHLDWWKSGKRPPVIKEAMDNGLILNGHSLEAEGLERMRALFESAKKGETSTARFMEELINLTTGSPFALQRGKQGVVKDVARAASGAAVGAASEAAMGRGAGSIAARAAMGAAQSAGLGRVAKYGVEGYQRSDDIFKIAFYENWKDILQKEGMSAADAGKAAAQKVNERTQVFAYGLRTAPAQALSDTGLVPFASWWENRARNHANIFREDPHLFALMQAQGTLQKAAGAATLTLTTGIPAKVLWDWQMKNPGMVPVGAYEDEETGDWRVVGWRHQYISPDPVGAAQEFLQSPGGALKGLAFQNPFVSMGVKGAVSLQGPDQKDPTFGEGRRLLKPGEPLGAGRLRFYEQGVGSAMGPAGSQTEEALALLSGDKMKSSVEPRSAFRTALSILAGIQTYDAPADSTKLGEIIYRRGSEAAGSWFRSAEYDNKLEKRPPDDPERLRVRAIYDEMLVDAYEAAIDKGARILPPRVTTPYQRERLQKIVPQESPR